MQINISARHGHLSETTQEKIRERVSKLERYFDRLTAILVTVDLADSEKPSVEVQVDAEHKHDFVSTVNGAEMWACLDEAVQKLEQQIRKYKERKQEHRGPGLRQQSAEAGAAETEEVE